MNSTITIRNARLHNLKNVSLEIPKNKLVVVTGLSGSGKSTLAFDILNKEGQRQYLESLGLVTWGVSKPPVDAIIGLSPSISVDQRLTNHSPRSTVGTVTEVFTYLRILYARLGHRPCPNCGKDVPPPTYDSSTEDWQDESDESPEGSYPCPHCGAPVPELSPNRAFLHTKWWPRVDLYSYTSHFDSSTHLYGNSNATMPIHSFAAHHSSSIYVCQV